MAKILITYLQPIISNNLNNIFIYYESFSKELIKQGNHVLHFNMINEAFLKKNKYNKWIEEQTFKIKNYNPDLIITFNNRISESIIQATNCPIVLFEADLVNYFANKNLIKKYVDRYYAVTCFENYIPDFLNIGIKKENMILCHSATSVKAEKLEKINNISFIGSYFAPIQKKQSEKILSFGDKLYKMFLDFENSERGGGKSLRLQLLCTKIFT